MDGSFFLFVAALSAFSPILCVGFIGYLVPIARERGKVASVGYETLLVRIFYHLKGTRRDPESFQLAKFLPATNALAMNCFVKPILWAAQLSGFTPNWIRFPTPQPTPFFCCLGARTEFIDDLLNERVTKDEGRPQSQTHCDQVVILGAGWDCRAYNLLKDRCSAVFEVDLSGTQKEKIEAVKGGGLNVGSNVKYVECDTISEGWLSQCIRAGLDDKKRTFVVMEGVSMYLKEEDVVKTMKEMTKLPVGSCIVFDMFSAEFRSSMKGKISSFLVWAFYKSPFVFSLPVTPLFQVNVEQFLRHKIGLSLGKYRVLPGKGVPYGGLVVGEVAPTPSLLSQ